MRKTFMAVMILALPGLAHAAVDCSPASLPQPLQPRATVLVPVSSELVAPSYRLGAHGGVLSHAYDESQEVDQVLLRLRIEGCQKVANAMPAAGAVNPNDPAAYKPQTAFDNSPWRFDMSQGGKRMTAEEFDAWMKARGVRIAKGAPKPAAAPVEAPAADAPPQAKPAE